MTLRPCPGTIVDMLPHRPPLVLLDEALGYSEEEVRTRATIGPDHSFITEAGVAGHVLIELMAQTCGVFVGAQALSEGRPVRPGFLLGSRNFATRRDWLTVGTVLDVTARLVFRDETMAVFDCEVDSAGERVADARLSVYQPPEGQSIMPVEE